MLVPKGTRRLDGLDGMIISLYAGGMTIVALARRRRKAVDFYALNGRVLTGADPQSIRLISMLDPIMPAGARVGQSQSSISLTRKGR